MALFVLSRAKPRFNRFYLPPTIAGGKKRAENWDKMYLREGDSG